MASKNTTKGKTRVWTGESGTRYRYKIFRASKKFEADAGNYIFAKKIEGRWEPIYAGETEDLSTRFDNHHRKACIKRHRGAYIHVHIHNGDDQARRDEETDIRQKYDPPCNLQ